MDASCFSRVRELRGSLEEFLLELRGAGVSYLERSGSGSSTLLHVSDFLEHWFEEPQGTVRILKQGTGRESVSANLRCLDPSLVSRETFEKCFASVLMSATLAPPERYADLLGLAKERTVSRSYDSPFPRDNRLVLVVPTVTTRFSERSFAQFQHIARLLERMLNEVRGNSAVFFPSFNVLESVLNSFSVPGGRRLFRQFGQSTSGERSKLLKSFRQSAGQGTGILFAVAGGSFSEGIDFPSGQLACVIVVGVPLREMSLEVRSLVDYYQEKFGRGRRSADLFPAMERALQAAGRVIRSETDRGVVAFFDERFTWESYAACLPRDWSRIETAEPEKYMRQFWGRVKNHFPFQLIISFRYWPSGAPLLQCGPFFLRKKSGREPCNSRGECGRCLLLPLSWPSQIPGREWA